MNTVYEHYHLLSIDTGQYYNLKDHIWCNYIEAAKKDGWQPDGTFYDPSFMYDEKCISESVEENMYQYLIVHEEQIHWEGSYTEKNNQVIDSVDAYYLALALEGIAEKELIEFLQKGSVRICG